MGNLPSCCGIISEYACPLELPKMTPFCMKITKNNSGVDPHTLFNNNSFRYYNIYAHAHTEPGSVQKKFPWKILFWSWHPSEPTFWTPPPPVFLGFFVSVFLFSFVFCLFLFFCFFKILLWMKINSLALVYLKINFLVELMLKINNLYQQNLPALPLPQNQMVAPKT